MAADEARRAVAVASIDVPGRALIVGRGRGRQAIDWARIGGGTLCRLPSLVDEVGLALVVDERELRVRETQEGFFALLEALAPALPADWYGRVEAGETIAVGAVGAIGAAG